jgi:hypothetical protein
MVKTECKDQLCPFQNLARCATTTEVCSGYRFLPVSMVQPRMNEQARSMPVVPAPLTLLPVDPHRCVVFWEPVRDVALLELRDASEHLILRTQVGSHEAVRFVELPTDGLQVKAVLLVEGQPAQTSALVALPANHHGDAPTVWMHVSDEFDVREVPGPERSPSVPLRATRPFHPSSSNRPSTKVSV